MCRQCLFKGVTSGRVQGSCLFLYIEYIYFFFLFTKTGNEYYNVLNILKFSILTFISLFFYLFVLFKSSNRRAEKQHDDESGMEMFTPMCMRVL